MADFAFVPIIDVTKGNLEEVWPTIVSAIQNATFVALDNELTGLGERKDLFARDIEQRYKGTSEVAKTRSVVSVGLSCFTLKETSVDEGGKSTIKTHFNRCTKAACMTRTEFKARMPASYLEYVFRASQRDNFTASLNGWSHTLITFPAESLPDENVISLPTALPSAASLDKKESCKHYAAHGWCQQGDFCPNSHDVDVILEGEHKQKKKRKTIAMETSDPPLPVGGANEGSVKLEARVRGHRAGFDAFMTGFIFAFFCARYGESNGKESFIDSVGFQEYRNKLFLSGKDIPLQVLKSGFAKTSKQHREKWTLVGNK
ncbi:hypothetical protein CAPTEDRAFT_205148 [Capitella teleta]|uniref:C3H1-type domain-containing protein n=1 Tax=Capitella teleta TaxID=283909 RepID=R7TZL2_CAPTE|nr:hypothetical protein CAPTEDRAFT_205148 [Capitella teleta]|eukprot:ELT96816.1 hypothetical protein CAPTEDRAFT_205148 [Capitella teleta]